MLRLSDSRFALFRFKAETATVLLLLTCIFTLQATAQREDDIERTSSTDHVELVLRKLTLQRLAGDHAELSATIEMTPSMAATLEEVSFRGMKLDWKTPVYVEPLKSSFTLKRGVPLVLHIVRMSVYYADFPAPSVMDSMLRAHQVRVTGEVRATLQLSLLGKLAARDRHPVAALSVDQTVPFDDETVDSTTQLGVGLLSLAQGAIGAGASVLERVGGVRITTHDDPVSPRILRSVVQVRTTFELSHRSERTSWSCVRLGFWIGPNQVVVPAEVLEPWMYSLKVAEAMSSAGFKLDESSIQTSVSPLMSAEGSDQGWNRARGDFTVLVEGHADPVRLLLPTGHFAVVRERESQGNFAVLQMSSPPGIPFADFVARPEEGPLRALRRTPQQDPSIHLVSLGRPMYPEADQMIRSVDESSFGSPLLLDQGVVGMVVGEKTVVSPGAISLPRSTSP